MTDKFDITKPINLLRIVCGLLFLPHIASKLLPPHAALGFFNATGFPAPEAFMYLAAAGELTACIGLVFGIRTRWAALLGAAVLSGASVALLIVGAKSMWLWNLGGAEYPVFWAIVCLYIAWTHRELPQLQITRQ